MSTDKNSSAPDVVIVNPEARLYDLAYYAGEPAAEIKDANGNKMIVPREHAHVHVVPGVNFVPAATLAKTGVTEHADLRIGVDLKALSVTEAKRLAEESANPVALKQWLKLEQRAPVRDAIELRLASRKVVAAA